MKEKVDKMVARQKNKHKLSSIEIKEHLGVTENLH